MPKVSKGLPYFTLDTDLASDKRVKLLKAEFGIKGFGIWVELLRQIYADEGFFMKWDKDTKLLFASDVGESGGVVDEVVNGLVKRGLFNESVFSRFEVLTSKHIQEKYFDAIKRRSSDLEVDARLLVIDTDADIIKGNVNIKLLNVNIKTQSRVEKSKVEESRRAPVREESPGGYSKINNTPLPEAFQNKKFVDQYRKYMEYMKTAKWSTVVTPAKTEQDVIELFRLFQQGNDPVAVIRQTIIGDNKSFYPLKEREFNKQKDEGSFDANKARQYYEAVPG